MGGARRIGGREAKNQNFSWIKNRVSSRNPLWPRLYSGAQMVRGRTWWAGNSSAVSGAPIGACLRSVDLVRWGLAFHLERLRRRGDNGAFPKNGRGEDFSALWAYGRLH